MGTALTGTTPQDTYDSLIKVTDNGPISGTAKYLSDGLGNDSVLALSTSKVGIGTATPVYNLHVNASGDSRIIITDSVQGSTANDGTYVRQSGVNSSIVNQENGTLQFGTNNSFAQTILANGNVGIGTSAPAQRLDISSGALITTRIDSDLTCLDTQGLIYTRLNNIGSIDGLRYASRSHRFASHANALYATIDVDGLKFGSDTAAANALDDYEEGTWTPSVAFGGASAGVVLSVANGGTYTKIGRQVTLNGFFAITSKGSSTGAATITGLPFTIGNAAQFYAAASLFTETISFANVLQGRGDNNTTTIQLFEVTEAGVLSTITNADFAATSNINISLTYFV